MFDSVDMQILKLLKENSRMNWKDIGKQVHLTGQAVGNRIRRLEDMGVIEQYTVALNEEKLGRPVTAFITIFVESANHAVIHKLFETEESIVEVHRISGVGCYLAIAHLASTTELDSLLGRVLEYGNYQLSISIGKLKPSLKN